MRKIVVVGSVNVDLCCYLDRWPEVNETVHSADFKQFLGGKGANQAAAAARLGADVTFIGAVGELAYADFAKGTLAAENMSRDLVAFSDQPTGMAFIDIGPNSDNLIRLVRGANAALSPADIERRAHVFDGASLLLLQNEVPISVSAAAARLAKKHGATVVMDPAPSPTERWPDEIVSTFDVITPNAVEASLYCGFVPETAEAGRDAASKIAGLLGCSAIVTMGGNGVAWSHNGATDWTGIPEVDPLDTVGAGDCFNGAFATALAESKDWPDAIRFAVNAASISTTRRGAMSSLPMRAEVHSHLETA